MKAGIIFVLYQTEKKEVERIESEVKKLGFSHYELYFIDNTGNGKGYAAGVNEGLKRAVKEKCDTFIVCNPDISFHDISAIDIINSLKHFDIAGFAMHQNNVLYYGGKVDRWRMSGGLISNIPLSRYQPVDFITGSFMVFTKKTIDTIGFFDESYFMYYEDVDYCYRARAYHLKVGIDTQKTYNHFENSRHNAHKDYMLAKNRMVFLMRYGSLYQKIRECIRSPKTLIEERHLLFNLIWNSQFVRNFFSLNISSIINKLLHFVLFITMVRFIPVKEYGIYTLVWAHVNIFSPLTDFGTTSYGMVYLPREKKDKVYSLFTLRALFSIVVFIITIGAGFIFRYSPQTLFFICIITTVIFYNMTSGMYLILSSVEGSVVRASFISIGTNAVMMGVLVGVSFLSKSIFSIFLVSSFFYLFYICLYLILLKQKMGSITFTFDYSEWRQIIKKSYIFVLINLFAGLYFRIDVFILNALQGPTHVGIYSSGYKFFDGLTLFASSFNTIAAPTLSRIAHENKQLLPGRLLKYTLFLTLVGFSAVGVTLLFGDLFLPHILKANYLGAIPVVQILVWALPFILYNSILLNLLYASDLSYLVIFLFMFAALVNAIFNYLFIPIFSYTASSYITVISECINLVILVTLVFIMYRKKIFNE